MKKKKCKECGVDFKPIFNRMQVACSVECAVSLANKEVFKKKELNKKLIEDGLREQKEVRSLGSLLNNVKNICHDYVKKRDYGKVCVSCGCSWHSDFQAGHYYKAELFSSLRFDENNIHGQCKRCNLRLEGNLSEYSVNLPLRIGKMRFKVLVAKAGIDKSLKHKWDREELKRIYDYYKQKIREL